MPDARREDVTMLTWRARIATLWLGAALLQSASTTLLLMQPGAVADLTAGRVLGEDVHSTRVQLLTLFSWLVPIALAYLTLALKPADSRSTNLVLAAGALLTGVAALVTTRTGPAVGYVVIALQGVVVPLLVLWHAWKWPGEDGAGRYPAEETDHR